MSDEAKDQDRVSDAGGGTVPYVRASDVRASWRALTGGGVLALLVALFVAVGVSSRDYSKAIADNLRDVTAQWNKNFEKLGQRVYDLEKWAWSKGKRD